MIEFTEDMTAALNNSFADRKIVEVVTASKDGVPDIAFKGSAMAWDSDHIAWWERSLGTTFSNVKENPNVCVLYANFEGRKVWKFFGVAEVHTEGPLRQKVMDRTVQAELDRDPERKGAAVIVRVDKIMQGPQVLQQRD